MTAAKACYNTKGKSSMNHIHQENGSAALPFKETRLDLTRAPGPKALESAHFHLLRYQSPEMERSSWGSSLLREPPKLETAQLFEPVFLFGYTLHIIPRLLGKTLLNVTSCDIHSD